MIGLAGALEERRALALEAVGLAGIGQPRPGDFQGTSKRQVRSGRPACIQFSRTAKRSAPRPRPPPW